MNGIDPIDFRLLNDWQRGLPLTTRPFLALAEALSSSETEVIERLVRLRHTGFVSRVGAVFRPHWLGWSTLAAVSVPKNQVERAAALINAHPEINHNYEREHTWNLWFVVTAPDRVHVNRVLDTIGRETGSRVLNLPMLEDYHLDLGFDLQHPGIRTATRQPLPKPETVSPIDLQVAHALEGGLELTSHPYAALAANCGLSEPAFLNRVSYLIEAGIIRRYGVIVRHRELGYTANAMVVWNIPDHEVSAIGAALGKQGCVTLCYQRPRQLPYWPYNLFTMVHGQDRAAVLSEIDDLRHHLAPAHYDSATLFSLRRFKQCGARYRPKLAQAA